jgi:hypothetical protein
MTQESPKPISHRRRLAIIALMALLAFWGSLRADFYMDDYLFVLNEQGDAPAERHWELPGLGAVTTPASPNSRPVPIHQLLPTSLWALTDVIVQDPDSGRPIYHLWNLLFHIATGFVAFAAGRAVLGATGCFADDQERARAAFLATLLFVCHPLCSEAVHYTKCLNHMMAACFGVAAVWQGTLWLQSRNGRNAAGCLVALLLTALSYYPGLPIAVTAIVLTAIARWRSTGDAVLAGSGWKLKASLLAVAAWGLSLYVPASLRQMEVWHAWRESHIYTQSRVFWDYLRMAVWPSGLCSDHLVAWSTTWKDPAALLGMAGIALLLGVCGTLLWRRRTTPAVRTTALVLLLGAAPLLVRLLYINQEVFVEYRAYYALPWLMLLAGCALTQLGKLRPRLLLPAGITALASFVILSNARSVTWTSRGQLTEDAIARYPLHQRARVQLQAFCEQTGQLYQIPALHQELLAAVKDMKRHNANSSRQYDTHWTPICLVHSSKYVICALAEFQNSQTALTWANRTISQLQAVYPNYFKGDLTLQDKKALPEAWPVIMARDTIRDHGAEIDAVRESRRRAEQGMP